MNCYPLLGNRLAIPHLHVCTVTRYGLLSPIMAVEMSIWAKHLSKVGTAEQVAQVNLKRLNLCHKMKKILHIKDLSTIQPQTICSRSDGQKLSIISDADGHVDGRSLAACNKLAVYPTRARIDASHTRNPPPLRFPYGQDGRFAHARHVRERAKNPSRKELPLL